MPTPDAILDGLTSIANGWKTLAIAWHGLVAAAAIGIAMRWRPTHRTVAAMSLLPLASVSALAWTAGNPVNGSAFAAVTIWLGRVARRTPAERVRPSASVLLACGAVLIGLAWTYPHFLETTDWQPYLYEAPMGLIPCPTLALTIGTTLLVDGHISKPWALSLASVGILYGTFGALALRVPLDLVLLGAAVVLAISALRIHDTTHLPVVAS